MTLVLMTARAILQAPAVPLICSWFLGLTTRPRAVLSRIHPSCRVASTLEISFVTFAILLAVVAMAADNDSSITFLYPPEGLTVNYLDTINVSYTSPWRKPYLVTKCLRYSGGDPLEKNGEYGHAYNSSILALIKWPEFASCYFVLQPGKTGGNGSLNTKSPWFRINSEARPTPVTFGLGLSENSTTIPTESPSSTTTSSATSTPASSGGLSSGAKIGIGVGLALGVLFIVAAIAAVFLLRRRKRAKRQAATPLMNSDAVSPTSEFGGGHEGHFMPVKSIPMEIQGKESIAERPHELPSDTTYEMGTEGRVGELSAEEGRKHNPGQKRVS